MGGGSTTGCTGITVQDLAKAAFQEAEHPRDKEGRFRRKVASYGYREAKRVAKHGTFQGAAVSCTPGKPAECNANARKAARESGGKLRYTEGYARFGPGENPVDHAWVTDEHGRAHEVTWEKPGTGYLAGTITKPSRPRRRQRKLHKAADLKGSMVALHPPKAAAESLAAKGGEPKLRFRTASSVSGGRRRDHRLTGVAKARAVPDMERAIGEVWDPGEHPRDPLSGRWIVTVDNRTDTASAQGLTLDEAAAKVAEAHRRGRSNVKAMALVARGRVQQRSLTAREQRALVAATTRKVKAGSRVRG